MKDYPLSPHKGLNNSIQRRYLGTGIMDDVLLSFVYYIFIMNIYCFYHQRKMKLYFIYWRVGGKKL